jgi:TolB-like protein/Tfp pilus assembly protein PilF
MKAFSSLVILGFPLALIFAWAFEMTPEGIKREAEVDRDESITHVTGRKLDFAIIGLLAIAVAYFAVDKFVPEAEPEQASVAREKSIAVLPCANMSTDPEDEYLAASLHDEILLKLQKVSSLFSIGRASVEWYRDHPAPLTQVAEELGVSFVGECSVQKYEGQIRLIFQLLDGRTGGQVWADDYDRDLTIGNLFDIQAEIAQQVAHAIGAELTAGEQAWFEAKPTESTKAYEAYLRGRFYLNRLLPIEPDFRRAIRHFEQSVEADSSFAPAYAGISQAYAYLGVFNVISPDSAWPNMVRAADLAVSLDPDSSEAQLAYGMSRYYMWDRPAAQEAFERALALNPNNVEALYWQASFLSSQGEIDQALSLERRISNLEPKDSQSLVRIAWSMNSGGRWDEAIDHLRGVLEEWPENNLAYWNLAVAYTGQGELEKALTAMHSAIGMMEADDLGDEYSVLGFLYGKLGRTREAREQLANLDRLGTLGRYISPVARSLVHLGLGEQEEALDLLEEGYRTRAGWMQFAMVGSYWEELRANPRFMELMRRVRKGGD